MDPTVTVAGLGLLAAVLSPILMLRLTARSQRDAKLDELLKVLYTEATIYAQDLMSLLNRITTPYTSRGSRPELTHSDVLTARMRLMAPEDINTAWQDVIANEERLRWNMEQDHPGFGHDPSDALDVDDADVVALRQAIERFYAVTRKASVARTK